MTNNRIWPNLPTYEEAEDDDVVIPVGPWPGMTKKQVDKFMANFKAFYGITEDTDD